MKSKLLTVFVILFFGTYINGFSQSRTVMFDYQNDEFNENMPLPSESDFIIKGSIDRDITVVTIAIFKNQKRRDTLYHVIWRRPHGNASNTYSIPVNFKLKGNKEYDLVFNFYRAISVEELAQFKNALKNNLESYLNSSLSVRSGKLTLRKSIGNTMNDLNEIVYSGFTYYKSTLPIAFNGFSEIVKGNLQKLDGESLESSKYFVATDSLGGESSMMKDYIEQLKQQAVASMMNEVSPYANDHLALLSDSRERAHYPTEKTPNYLALNVGYGGVYLSGDWDNMDYASAPFAGISFPLGNKKFSTFWGNTSVSVGVFLKNLKNEDGEKITGPIVGLPYYGSLGYKFLNIFRIQAGAVVTSTEKFDDFQSINIKKIKLKPFIGLSAEINLWLGFNKK